jgi:hypothetical protein
MTFTNTTSSQTSSQSTQSDTVTIGGPAFGYKDLPDVIYYLDNIYGTFMYQIPTEPPVASGMVVDHAGKPVAKQTVTLTIGSRKFTGYTDSHGEYRFYNLPAAQGTLSVEGKTFSVAVGPGAAKPTLRPA